MKKKWYALIVLILVAGYSLFHYIRYSPHRNPNPKYFVTIKGTVSPGLQDKIRFYMSYATSAERCEHQGFNYSYGKSKSINIKPQFNNKNEYSIVLPLDKYKSGWCNWSANNFGYYFTNNKIKNEQYLVDFDDNADPYFPNASNFFSKKSWLDFSCFIDNAMFGDGYIKLQRCASKNNSKDSGTLFKPIYGNYSLTINFSGDNNATRN